MWELPQHDAEELDWVLFEQSGVLTTAQATDLIGRLALRRHLRQGRWRTICRGVVLTCNGELGRDQQLWVAVLAAGPGAHLAGSAAATENGIRGLPPAPIQVLIPGHRRRTDRLDGSPSDMPAVSIHRTNVFPESHRQVGRPPRTTTARSVIDAAAWARSDRGAQQILLMACQQRRVQPAELQETLKLLPRIHRHRLIAVTLADAAGGAEALSEIDLVELCRRHGLPEPDLQRHRKDADGRNRYLDAYWDEWRLHVEIDGSHHMDARSWGADMLRQNQVWLQGDRILRFPAWLLRTDPDAVVAQLRRALASPASSSPPE